MGSAHSGGCTRLEKFRRVAEKNIPLLVQKGLYSTNARCDGDENYQISLQGSSQSDFSSDYEDLAILELGSYETLGGDQGSDTGQDSTIGRYMVPFRTERNGTIYQYARVYCDVSGTIATGINYSAHLAK